MPSVKKEEQSSPPADLRVLKNFINEDEEQQLMASLKECIYAKSLLLLSYFLPSD